MNTKAYLRASVILHLEAGEKFERTIGESHRATIGTGKRLRFLVTTLSYDGGGSVVARGPSINTDGQQGVISREDRIFLSELPKEILIHLLTGTYEVL